MILSLLLLLYKCNQISSQGIPSQHLFLPYCSFSSRGPTIDKKLKPDISAPGQNITTAWRTSNSDYFTGSGTSFAAPHVCGSVALMWSAFPKLKRQVKETMSILYRSARKLNSSECGGNGSPNYTFGFGSLDVYAAYQLAKKEGWGN